VLAGFGYLWFDRPEYLTWWKRTIDSLVDTLCGALPYPWGDRVESTIGNFGVWVQLTLAIILTRAALGLGMIATRSAYRRRRAAKARRSGRRI
jgi:hypothetical protein